MRTPGLTVRESIEPHNQSLHPATRESIVNARPVAWRVNFIVMPSEFRVDPNPYEPPLTSSVRQLERLTLSPLRIPLAILCCVITPLFVATFFGWCGNLLRDGTTSEVGRLAFVYIPLSIVGIASFGSLAAGLIAKWPRMVGLGLGLFAVGALIQIVVMLAP